MLKLHSNFDPIFHFLKDQYKDKPFTIWHETFPTDIRQLQENPYNFLILLEPNEFFGLHDMANHYHGNFTCILTWSELILKNCSNAIRFTFNGRVLDDEFIESIKNKEKIFEVSFLCGDKSRVEGHQLRHKVHATGDYVTIPKKWFYVLDDYDHTNGVRPGYGTYGKDLSHVPEGIDIVGYGKRVLYDSMFNVVIENVKHNNWYNKIGDNFLTKTVPIYWGCPNLEEFGYDERGIIRFKDEKELPYILNSLTSETYNQMKPYIDYNYKVAKLDHVEIRATQFFDNFIELNNI
jgi:hypothetical protein